MRHGRVCTLAVCVLNHGPNTEAGQAGSCLLESSTRTQVGGLGCLGLRGAVVCSSLAVAYLGVCSSALYGAPTLTGNFVVCCVCYCVCWPAGCMLVWQQGGVNKRRQPPALAHRPQVRRVCRCISNSWHTKYGLQGGAG